MAKLTKVAQKLFGSGAGANQIAVFGSLFAGASAFTTNVATAMSLSNWLTGWLGAAIGGNSPAIEDMNACMFVFAYQLGYLMQAGVAEWDTDTIYYIGSFANVAGELYVSLTDSNQGNLVTDTTKWKAFRTQHTLSAKSANYTLTVSDEIVEFDCTTGLLTATLATLAAGLKGATVLISKTDSSTNPLVVSGAAVAVQLNAQYDSATLLWNGSVWYPV